MKPILSIVFVYYNTPNEIVNAVKSISYAADNIRYEITIIDNASSEQIPLAIAKYKHVKIIKNDRNYGYGKAINQLVKSSSGKYVLLANSDIQFDKNAIKSMIDRIERNNQIGVVGPFVINEKGEKLQSISGMPFLPRALVIFSFLGKIWPTNIFYKNYHNEELDRTKEHEVDVVGGVCMLVRKSVFEKVGGFDERFFMYFEEADFCYRIKQLGYKIIYYPKAKIVHFLGRSTTNKKWIQGTFEQSRFKFFQKYHGTFLALLAEEVLRFLAPNLIVFTILAISAFLNLHRLPELMSFIGDQGWFYLSARDMLMTGNIPLVGIFSSHPWLHQGPLWTYILALIFWIFKFNPVAPAYFTAILGVITVLFMYRVGSEFFSKKAGAIAAALYAVSPLVVIQSRTPYHTSLIPLFTLLFIYSLYKLVKGNSGFFPLVILFLAILYNLELFTAVLWFVVFIILIYGVFKKKMWLFKILNRKILFLLTLFFIIPMMPILIYDIQNGFPQTIKFVAWIGYRSLRFLGLPSIHANATSENLNLFTTTSASYVKHLVFLQNETIAVSIFILSFGFFFTKLYCNRRKGDIAYIVLGLTLIISLLGYFVNKIPSGAYIPVFFPLIIFLIALFFENLMKLRFLKIPSILILLFILFFNAYSLISQNYLAGKGYSFIDRLSASKQIIKTANVREYNLIGKGEGSQFKSFIMNYKYLTWWLGKGESEKRENLRIVIKETSSGIIIKQEFFNE